MQAFAKSLVNADRCALFMVDSKSNELYANLFDDGDEDGSGYKFRNGAEIRYKNKLRKINETKRDGKRILKAFFFNVTSFILVHL